MKTRMCLGVSFAGFLGLLLVAGTAGAQVIPSAGEVTSATAADGVAGTFEGEEITLDYESRITPDGQSTAIILQEGKVLAEAVIGAETAAVTLNGVEITATELTDEESKIVADFTQTREAAAIRALVTALADQTPPESRAKIGGLIAIGMMLGEGPGARISGIGGCFGCCGPGCWGCWLAGNCYTLACTAHDACVALWGHTDKRCLALLAVAIASYAKECLGLAVF